MLTEEYADKKFFMHGLDASRRTEARLEVQVGHQGIETIEHLKTFAKEAGREEVGSKQLREAGILKEGLLTMQRKR